VFGVATSTLDAAGDVLAEQPMSITREDVESVMPQFLGDVEQVPPMVSAVKVGGRRLHELARAGEEVERAPRPVHIERIDVEDFVPGEHPVATVHVECGSGTYVRTLAADLGAALGGPAHLGWLRRVRVGTFTEADAVALDTVERDPDAALLTPAAAMRALAPVVVDPDRAAAVAHGSPLPGDAVAADGPGPFAVLDGDGALLAVYERRGSGLRPAVVVAS
jgi:tRNA pseudouridine55 synthase